MSTSIIDGTVEEVVPGRGARGIKVLKSIRFQPDNGPSRTMTKMVVKQEIADELTPGARGRFYLYNAFDTRGVHGVRTPDGRAVYGFPGNNQKIFLILGIVSVLWISLRVFGFGDVPLLGVAFLIFAVVGWILMGKGAKESKAQFDGDAGYSPSEGPALTRPL